MVSTLSSVIGSPIFLNPLKWLLVLMALFMVLLRARKGSGKGSLSPFLFSLAEDVLSIHLSRFFIYGILAPIKATKEAFFLSHIFYANDILVFCKGKTSKIIFLKQLFSNYSIAFCQNIDSKKSAIFLGSMNNSRAYNFIHLTGFTRDSLPFSYSGFKFSKAMLEKFVVKPFLIKL